MLNYYLVFAVISNVAKYIHAYDSVPISCDEPYTEYNPCKNNCTDQCPTMPPRFCTRECAPGCYCQQDYSRATNGTCVPTLSCPVDCGDDNEIFDKRCIDTCYEDIARCATTGYGCYCKPGYKRIGAVCVSEANCFHCGKNEVYSECTNPCFDECPGPEPNICPDVCSKGCACKENYKRDPKTNQCIPIEDCKQCGKNEVYGGCSNQCFEKCPGSEPTACPLSCAIGCSCKDTYKRDPITNECIPIEDCPSCGENEVYSNCSNPCFDSCQGPEPTFCPQFCTVGCACQENYKRDPTTNQCIPIEDCNTCGANEVASECSNSCLERCPGPVALPCPFICSLGCACKENYKRDPATNECIPIEDCNTCGENEVFSNCSNPCFDKCPGPEPTICPEFCTIGCACQENYKRDPETNQCIPIEDCNTCGENEIYRDCSNPCFDKCTGTVQMVCPEPCLPGCGCQDNYTRDNVTNQCVPIRECDDCGERQVYVECKNPYIEACPGPQPTDFPMICEEGCVCETNYRRDAKTKECVLIQDCNVDCPPYSTFGCICNDSCDKDKIQCIQCLYSCACDAGYSRINGTCQPDSLCPTPTSTPTPSTILLAKRTRSARELERVF